MSVYPGLQLLSPLATVEEMLADELEESLGEVVKFLDGVVLVLVSRGTKHVKEKHISIDDKCCVNLDVLYMRLLLLNEKDNNNKVLAYLGWEACLGHVPSSFLRSITSTCGKTS